MAAFDLDNSLPPSGRPPVLTVSQLTAEIKDALEATWPDVWVSGEISNFSRPQSGHAYFTLKDDDAQIRAVMWRSTAQRVRFELEDGLEVICRGALDVYAPRGSYQLVVSALEPRGLGALEQRLRQLRAKLAAEGLFDPARKRPLPRFPRRIAIVTSPTGAAVRDFLEVIRRRWRGVDVLVVPTPVQGDGAAGKIAAAIAAVNRMTMPVDVLVVARGGGSLEDLWAFNEEVVVRAIHASRIPVVSGVGHEIDVTLADLVADVRALTPSEAAERVVPARDEVAKLLDGQRQRLATALATRAARARMRLDHLASRRPFAHPLDGVHALAQRLDELSARASRAVQTRVGRLRDAANARSRQIEALSPLAVLSRGYSLTQLLAAADDDASQTPQDADGELVRSAAELVRSAAELAPGDRLRTRFAHGEAISRVERVIETT